MQAQVGVICLGQEYRCKSRLDLHALGTGVSVQAQVGVMRLG